MYVGHSGPTGLVTVGRGPCDVDVLLVEEIAVVPDVADPLDVTLPEMVLEEDILLVVMVELAAETVLAEEEIPPAVMVLIAETVLAEEDIPLVVVVELIAKTVLAEEGVSLVVMVELMVETVLANTI